jgi:uncharacterized protein (TIGR00369 family)
MTELHEHIDEPLARHLGLVRAERDETGDGIRAVFEARPEQTHTHGTVVQGGVVSAWLDNAMALAVIAVDPTTLFASIDLQVSFIRVAKLGENHLRARIVEQGRSVIFLEAEARNPEGQLVARATSAAKVLRPR